MNISSFAIYFREVRQLLEYGEYSNLLKRLIDLTLDTEDILFYKKTVDFIEWFEKNQSNETELKERFEFILNDIESFLSSKEIKQPKLLLEVNNLSKSYNHSPFTLGPINFNISEGEIIGLVGENGNGKTTLLRSLCGELEPTNGDIKYHFNYKNEYDLRTQLIYIPQRTKDWHGSLLSNLRFTASSYGIKGDENILLTELIITRMGLRKYRALGWKNLSSGYKMRFELARMLLRKPQLLLIDEPLANLDILAQQVILDDFRNIAKSPFRPLGIVLSSQQLYEVEKTSDLVIFLKAGKPTNTFSKKDSFKETADPVKLIIEFESDYELENLRNILQSLSLEKIHIKGGTYVATFPSTISQEEFLRTILDNKVPVNYFRNISNSTSRFFLA